MALGFDSRARRNVEGLGGGREKEGKEGRRKSVYQVFLGRIILRPGEGRGPEANTVPMKRVLRQPEILGPLLAVGQNTLISASVDDEEASPAVMKT